MGKVYGILVVLLCVSCFHISSKAEDIKAIRNVLHEQEKAWSANDIEGFMEGYLKSDSIAYYGSNGLTYGWKKMLARYQVKYPTKEYTGNLTFNIAKIDKISEDAYWVMGEYQLIRKMGNAKGTFMIILKRIHGKWKIVADSSC